MKTDWVSHGYTVSYTLFFVFCAFFIVDLILSTRVINAERKARKSGVPTILPYRNLETAPESLRLDLRVELRDFPTEEMTKMEAWSELQNTVSEYARRLEFVEGQNRLIRDQNAKRLTCITFLYGLSGIGIVFFTILSRRSRVERADKIERVGSTPG